jgi:hypothetical protein
VGAVLSRFLDLRGVLSGAGSEPGEEGQRRDVTDETEAERSPRLGDDASKHPNPPS